MIPIMHSKPIHFQIMSGSNVYFVITLSLTLYAPLTRLCPLPQQINSIKKDLPRGKFRDTKKTNTDAHYSHLKLVPLWSSCSTSFPWWNHSFVPLLVRYQRFDTGGPSYHIKYKSLLIRHLCQSGKWHWLYGWVNRSRNKLFGVICTRGWWIWSLSRQIE